MANIAKLAAKLTADDKGFLAPIARAGKAIKGLYDRLTSANNATKRAKPVDDAARAEKAAKAMEKQAGAAVKLANSLASLKELLSASRRIARALELVGKAGHWSGRRMERLAVATLLTAKHLKQFLRAAIQTNHALQSVGDAAEKAAKKKAKLSKSIGTLGGTLGWLKGVIAAAVVVLTVGYVGKLIDADVATLRFARRIGSTVANVNAIGQALRHVGADADDAKAILWDLTQTLVDATSGDSAKLGTFARIGLDAEKLAQMDPAKSFREVVDAIAQIENRQARAAAAAQIFGEHASNLMPVIDKGAAGLDEMAKQAERMGLALTDADAAELEQGNIKFAEMEAALKGVVRQLVVNLLPAANALIHEFGGVGGAGLSAGQAVAVGLSSAIKAAGFLVDVWDIVDLTFNTFRWTVVKLFQAYAAFLEFGIEHTTRLADAIGLNTEALHGMLDVIGNTKEEMKGWAGEIEQGLNKTYASLGRGAKEAEKLDRALKSTGEHAKHAGELADAAQCAAGALQMAAVMQKLFNDRAMAVKNEVLTPLETFTNRMAELDKMWWTPIARPETGDSSLLLAGSPA